jgi:hypothetical protein
MLQRGLSKRSIFWPDEGKDENKSWRPYEHIGNLMSGPSINKIKETAIRRQYRKFSLMHKDEQKTVWEITPWESFLFSM